MNARVKKRYALELSLSEPILRLGVILQHDWPIEQCLLHKWVFFGGKTKRPCFDLFNHWLIKQITNTYRNHFSRSCENCSTILVCFLMTNVIIRFCKVNFWPSSLNWQNLFRPGTSFCLKKSLVEYNTNDTLILREIMLNES